MIDFEKDLESIESEAEEAVERETELVDREQHILAAIQQIGDDAAIKQLLEKSGSSVAAERSEAELELDQLRYRANLIHEALVEMSEDRSHTIEVLNTLSGLGEDVSEAYSILEERQMLIDRCGEALQRVMELLGISAGGLENAVGHLGGGSGGQGSERSLESSAEEKRQTPEEAFRSALKVEPESRPVQYCCGVLTHGTLPEGYQELIRSRIDAASAPSRKLFRCFAGRLVIQNTENLLEHGAYYAPVTILGQPRGVYYNAVADMNNLRGSGTTYFHELGHMIDHVAAGENGCVSGSEAFHSALIADGQRALRIVEKMEDGQREGFRKGISKHSAHSCSDLLDAVTEGLLHGRYGHERSYWNTEGSLQREAFAHFFEASMGSPAKERLLRSVFPSAYQEYDKIVASLINAEELRERER